MIQKISIKNFKSIKEVEFSVKRINLFIGKPNTGKSNLLEAIGVFSLPYVTNQEIKSLVRLERSIDLFYDNQTLQKINVKADDFIWEAFSEGDNIVIVGHQNENKLFHISIDINCNRVGWAYMQTQTPFKFYRFKPLTVFPKKEFSFLLPPNGENLLTILLSREDIYQLANTLLEEYGLEIIPEEAESKIKILKRTLPKPILQSFSTLSDTFQRIIFYLTAIKSNKDSILIFEEPEAHAFPYYTKILAENIALDNSNNQYFVSTHNPYLLLSILEKAPKNNVAIFVTYLEDYQTKLKELSEEDKEEILNQAKDIFFNIEKFVPER